jgi:hypothetical protein
VLDRTPDYNETMSDGGSSPHEEKRYMSSKPGRRCLNWNQDPYLPIVKMLAWAIYPGQSPISTRLDEVCPRIFAKLTGEKGVTFEKICRHTLETQGLPITENKLVLRAYNTECNQEFNGWEDKVLAAYKEICEEESRRRREAHERTHPQEAAVA